MLGLNHSQLLRLFTQALLQSCKTRGAPGRGVEKLKLQRNKDEPRKNHSTAQLVTHLIVPCPSKKADLARKKLAAAIKQLSISPPQAWFWPLQLWLPSPDCLQRPSPTVQPARNRKRWHQHRSTHTHAHAHRSRNLRHSMPCKLWQVHATSPWQLAHTRVWRCSHSYLLLCRRQLFLNLGSFVLCVLCLFSKL